MVKLALYSFAVFLLLTSCKKEGYGDLVVSVSNSTSSSYSVGVWIDGSNKGSFVVLANQEGNYSGLCSDQMYAASLQNVRVLNYIPSGKHKIELINDANNEVMSSMSIDLSVDGCSNAMFFW